MSEATGTFILDTGSGTGTVYTRVEVTIQDRAGYADTQSTITVKVGAKLSQYGEVTSSGVKGNIIIDATKVVDARTIFGCGTHYVSDGNYIYIQASRNVTKGHTARTAEYCYGEYHQYYENSDQGYKLTTWPSPRVVIPAKTSYTVRFIVPYGTGNAPSPQTKWYGESFTVPSNKPTLTGYTFVKWNTEPDGTGYNFNAGETCSNSYIVSAVGNRSFDLYPIFQKNTWVVKCLPNGGTPNTPITLTKSYQTPLTLPSTGFERANYQRLKWNTSADGGGTDYGLGAEYTANADLTLYMIWALDKPNAPTSFDASFVGDSISLNWTRPDDADATWQGIIISTSMDGGETYATEMAVDGTATNLTFQNTRQDTVYRFMLRAYNNGNGGQYSTAAYSGLMHTNPSTPSDLTARERESGSTDVVLELTNTSNNATGFEVEYSDDGSTGWGTSGMTVISSVGTPVTQIVLGMPSGGTHYFRVRNVGTHSDGTKYSGWAVTTEPVRTIAPPFPPINLTPSNIAVPWIQGATIVDFAWDYQSADGSPQESAQIRYKVGEGSWTTVTSSSSAQTYRLTASFANKSSVTWQVRTKGADPDYGDWSATETFSVVQAPSLSIVEPVPPSKIVGVPVNYSLTYTDNGGTFASGTLTIIHNGNVEYSERLSSPDSGTILGAVYASEFLPIDGETYTFKYDVSSNTQLTATAQAVLECDMREPYAGTLQITNDPETGYAALTYGWDTSQGQPADWVKLYRVTPSGRMELATSESGSSNYCLDMYAPLNTDYEYLVITHDPVTNAIAQRMFQNRINTGWWFVYYGNGKIARAKWNPNGSKTVSRPERTRVHYIGRKDPVSYDGTAVLEESGMEWRIVEREYAMQFLEMVREIGRGIYKSGSGEVYHADFDSASVSSDFHKNQPYGSISLPIVRIDGEAL